MNSPKKGELMFEGKVCYFDNFTVEQRKEGQLIVTAKSGFTVRLASDDMSDGIHVHAKEYGESNNVCVVSDKSGKLTRRSSRTTSFFPLLEKA